MAAESYEMSNMTLLNDTDRHIIHAFGTKTVLFTSSSGAFGASSLVRWVLCFVATQLL